MSKISLYAVSAVALFMSGLAQASVVASFPPNQTCGSDLNSFLEADNFMIAAPTEITQVKFWALIDTPADFTGSVDWAFYSDLLGMPNASVASGNALASGVATGQTTFGLNEFAYTFAVDVNLTPGAYWLVLHNGPSAAIPSTTFYWAWAGDSGDSVSQDLSVASSWAGNSSELAFALTAADTAAPEPVSTVLVGCGIAAGCLLRRKQKGAKG